VLLLATGLGSSRNPIALDGLDWATHYNNDRDARRRIFHHSPVLCGLLGDTSCLALAHCYTGSQHVFGRVGAAGTRLLLSLRLGRCLGLAVRAGVHCAGAQHEKHGEAQVPNSGIRLQRCGVFLGLSLLGGRTSLEAHGRLRAAAPSESLLQQCDRIGADDCVILLISLKGYL